MQDYLHKRFSALVEPFFNAHGWTSSVGAGPEPLVVRLTRGVQDKYIRLVSIIDLEEVGGGRQGGGGGGGDPLLQRLLCFQDDLWPDDQLYLELKTSETWRDRSREDVIHGRARNVVAAIPRAIEKRESSLSATSDAAILFDGAQASQQLMQMIRAVLDDNRERLLKRNSALSSQTGYPYQSSGSFYESEMVFLEHARVFGLCMGLSEYDGEFQPLAAAEKDAMKLHQTLCSFKNCHSALCSNPRTLEDMKGFLRSNLTSLEEACPEQVLFFFAGHAIFEPTCKDQLLVPTALEAVRSLSSTQLLESMLSITELFRQFRDFERNVALGTPRVLVIVDACREKVECKKENLRAESDFQGMPTFWTLVQTCSNGQVAFDDSAFFQAFLDPCEGMFACNQSLQRALLQCCSSTNTNNPKCVLTNVQNIPEDFCVISDGKDLRVVMSSVIETQKAARYVTSNASWRTDASGADTCVLAYSAQDSVLIRQRASQALKHFVSKKEQDIPRWSFCSMVIMLFLQYDDTRFSSKTMLGHLLAKVKNGNVGPELCEDIQEYLRHGRITSPSFEAWKEQSGLNFQDNKLLIAILDFTVTKEIRKVMPDPQEQRDALLIWEIRVVKCYKSSTSWEKGMDLIEEHLRHVTVIDDGEDNLFYCQVLEKAADAGSFAMILKMTKLSSVFLSCCLLEYNMQHNVSELDGLSAWVSSTGWIVREDGYNTDWTVSNALWSNELTRTFQTLERCEVGMGPRSDQTSLQQDPHNQEQRARTNSSAFYQSPSRQNNVDRLDEITIDEMAARTQTKADGSTTPKVI
ncbi:hypothetical protein GUITHDRAFT_111492 [Guillardia theta CCMP2712]|uniref:Peptidase C14 caspase domain-containing protein n=1 Tax=Guillardia theta (strain CCMP2712) TaxID=905079 RepID=L1J1X0_GUITC|nr:hypothetical protein GUITHDRAFT_111492 [Guillardia theta CCMP2712]EKX42516.1 hypothetical protein GUITHDRAFT_111492 [Guillardia theta CCMP2712]|eukprot:XP_005829496.1 hypothetical protein GUITHDRAFT_111492 [Guillardia theta CCMP2712]